MAEQILHGSNVVTAAEQGRRERVAEGVRCGGLGSVAKIVKLEHAWRRLDGRNDDGFQVAPFPG